jgi:hypothetical protein
MIEHVIAIQAPSLSVVADNEEARCNDTSIGV